MTYLTFSTLAELQDAVCKAPAIAYVRETGCYYLMHDYTPEIANTVCCSFQGIGWQAMDVSSPRYDRQIHLVKTRCLNGWDLDYYPRYVSALVKPPTLEDFELLCGSPGSHDNTDIPTMNPGDLILRVQEWTGTIKTLEKHYLGLQDITGEVSSKYFDASNLPLSEDDPTIVAACYKSLSYFTIAEKRYNIVDHWPNGRNANPSKWLDQTNISDGHSTKYKRIGDPNPLTDSLREDMWRAAEEDTKGVFTLEELPYKDIDLIGEEVTIKLMHWYIVSTQYYQKDFPPEVDEESTVKPPGPVCWEYTYLASGDLPARFDRVLFDQTSDARTLDGQEYVQYLLEQLRALPGDFTYSHPASGWFQIMEEGTADVIRLLTLPNLKALKDLLPEVSDLKGLCVLLRKNRKGETYRFWAPQGLSSLGDLTDGLTTTEAGVPEVFYMSE